MKKIIVSLFAILLSISMFAQKLHLKGFELYGSASTGMFGYNYNPANGSQLNGPGLRVGIGGGFFPTPHWGFTTGVDFATYTAFSSIKAGTSYTYTTYDSDGLPYTEQIKVDSKIKEQDILYRIELPLMLHYRYYLPSGNALYVAGGIKVSLPLAGYYHVSGGSVTTTGKYENLNTTLSDLPWLGFTSTDLKGNHGMLSTQKSYNALFEIGYLKKLRKTTYLTFSAFGEYGLNDAQKTVGSTNLIYPSLQYIGIPCSNTVNFNRLMSFGVKAAWHVNISGEPLPKGKKKTYEQPQKSIEPPSNNQTKGGHQRMGR
ncbi:MAG: OmpA/MotB domain protein [Bacteroidetes bacterium]|jgi:hypothetical protein|nr:OmpA/MotB domain protein [Bacteroidota bacterium]